MIAGEISEGELKTTLDDLRVKHGVVGCTIAVLANGTITTASSGILNLATGVECTDDSVFQIGSIGKVFTATLMMQLVDEGRVNLDDAVIRHLPDFTLADPAAARAITIRQLLNHTSGMDGDFFPADDPEGPSTVSYVRKLALLPNIYPPGEGPMTYCNSGFVVAGRIIEVLTGATWQNAVMDRICRPLGMPAAFAHPHESLRFRCAMGHIADPNDVNRAIVAPATFLPVSAAAAGAVLSMSAESLLLLGKAHMADGKIDGGRQLLSAGSVRAMRDDTIDIPPFTLSGLTAGITHWGIGWFLSKGGDYTMAGHGGATMGHYTRFDTYPDKGRAYVLLTNSPSEKLAADVENWMMRSLVGAPRVAEPPRQAFELQADRYVGEYANIGGHVSVTFEGGQLALEQKSGALPQPVSAVLEPYRPDTFEMKSDNPTVAGKKVLFLEDDGGRARFIRMGGRMGRRLPG